MSKSKAEMKLRQWRGSQLQTLLLGRNESSLYDRPGDFAQDFAGQFNSTKEQTSKASQLRGVFAGSASLSETLELALREVIRPRLSGEWGGDRDEWVDTFEACCHDLTRYRFSGTDAANKSLTRALARAKAVYICTHGRDPIAFGGSASPLDRYFEEAFNPFKRAERLYPVQRTFLLASDQMSAVTWLARMLHPWILAHPIYGEANSTDEKKKKLRHLVRPHHGIEYSQISVLIAGRSSCVVPTIITDCSTVQSFIYFEDNGTIRHFEIPESESNAFTRLPVKANLEFTKEISQRSWTEQVCQELIYLLDLEATSYLDEGEREKLRKRCGAVVRQSLSESSKENG